MNGCNDSVFSICGGISCSFGVFAIGDVLKKKKIISVKVAYFAAGGYLLFFLISSIQYNLESTNEVAMFEKTLGYNPQNARIRVSYALALAKRGRFEDVEKQFRMVLEDEPWNVRARIGLGKALIDQEKYTDGLQQYELKENIRLTYEIIIRIYQGQIKSNPNNADLHYSLGVIYSKTGNIYEAVNAYEQAVALNPAHLNALFNLASSCDALGRQRKMVEYYERLIAQPGVRDFRYKQAFLRLGEIYKQLGQFEKAQMYLEEGGKI